MKDNDEINPINKKHELSSLLKKLNYKFEIHTSNKDKEYEYLNENDVCITIPNLKCPYPIHIDLEDNGEFTLSYYKWHAHYFNNERDYNIMCEDLSGLLTNNKCVIIINSSKRWLSSDLSETKLTKNYNYKDGLKKLPKEFQKEIKELKGNIELFYWDTKDNIEIDI